MQYQRTNRLKVEHFSLLKIRRKVIEVTRSFFHYKIEDRKMTLKSFVHFFLDYSIVYNFWRVDQRNFFDNCLVVIGY